MVHSPSPLVRALGLLAIAAAGCTAIDKTVPAIFSVAPSPKQVEVVWSKQVQLIPDPLHGGAPNPAITGRMYVFGGDNSGKPIFADGKLTVELYDDTTATVQGPKLIEQVNFPADVLARQQSKDQLGSAYAIGVPCPPGARRVHLSTRFELATGGKPLVYSSEVITLDWGNSLPPTAGR